MAVSFANGLEQVCFGFGLSSVDLDFFRHPVLEDPFHVRADGFPAVRRAHFPVFFRSSVKFRSGPVSCVLFVRIVLSPVCAATLPSSTALGATLSSFLFPPSSPSILLPFCRSVRSVRFDDFFHFHRKPLGIICNSLIRYNTKYYSSNRTKLNKPRWKWRNVTNPASELCIETAFHRTFLISRMAP